MFCLLLLETVNEIGMKYNGDFITYLCKIIIWAPCVFGMFRPHSAENFILKCNGFGRVVGGTQSN